MILLLGDCLEQLKTLPDSSVDAVVTDPPYGLAFMGKRWDYDVPSVDVWREVFRVMKPGAHLLSFGGTRTYHRMVVAIEDAGFEIRDQVMWLYGSGFPKSLDVSKAIDKAAGAEREVVGPGKRHASKEFGGEKYGEYAGGIPPITAPATPDAKAWSGWGTALKPANEPIVLARKPLEKGLTVAQNVLKWGTGAINVDAGRIGMRDAQTYTAPDITGDAFNSDVSKRERKVISVPAQGRWPANVLLDEVVATHGEWTRYFYIAKASKRERNAGLEGMPVKSAGVMDDDAYVWPKNGDGSPRNKKVELRANHHPTVKPIKLMQYLVKLITPPGGVVLDPFMGSGSTGCAARSLGHEFIGIEREAEYMEIARRRIEHWAKDKEQLEMEEGA